MMKLSDAMRLGSLLKPQGTKYLEWNGHTCAIGAAMEAVGIDVTGKEDYPDVDCPPEWQLQSRRVFPPDGIDVNFVRPGLAHDLGVARMYLLGDAITTLNDTHGWTREQIADWLDSLDTESLDTETTEETITS